jgi:hypothetical protein
VCGASVNDEGLDVFVGLVFEVACDEDVYASVGLVPRLACDEVVHASGGLVPVWTGM